MSSVLSAAARLLGPIVEIAMAGVVLPELPIWRERRLLRGWRSERERF